MSRLTEKGTFFKTEGHYQDIRKGNVIDKLGKLEDLEDELGCPLEVVFKALKDGIYFNFNRTSKKEEFIESIDLSLKLSLGGFYCLYFEQWNDGYEVDLAYYKKTWFLKGDLSE